jgi:hypothetical protein
VDSLDKRITDFVRAHPFSSRVEIGEHVGVKGNKLLVALTKLVTEQQLKMLLTKHQKTNRGNKMLYIVTGSELCICKDPRSMHKISAHESFCMNALCKCMRYVKAERVENVQR